MVKSLTLKQKTTGYRYNRDSFLLADFFRPRGAASLIDLGAGVGVVSILIGRTNPNMIITAVEINKELAAQAMSNARQTGLTRYHTVVANVMDTPNMLGEGRFDCAVSNPPYHEVGSGRICADPARAAARHELTMTLEGLVKTSARLLREGGRLFVTMIHERRAQYERILAGNGFFETRHRQVLPLPDGKPILFLSEVALGVKLPKTVEPPLALRSTGGGDSDEYKLVASRQS